jgi:CheY-like chemotaxis protein
MQRRDSINLGKTRKSNVRARVMRIAIADDDQDVVAFLKSIVEEMGHTTTSFSDGAAISQSLMTC